MLQLTARSGHELACGSCGAPLHEMKALKQSPERPVKHRPVAPQAYRDDRYDKPRRKKKHKSRKIKWKSAFEEVFDLVEDIFD